MSAASGKSVFQAVADIGCAAPDAPALSGDGVQWTYRALVEDAERFAAFLQAQGCGAGSTFGILAANDAITCVLWLGAARLGAAVCLLNPLLKGAELSDVLGNLRPQLLISDAANAELCDAAVRSAGLSIPIVALDRGLLAEERFAGPHPQAGLPHEISYTSGTTGQPKGAVLTHDIVLHRAREEVAVFDLTARDVTLVVTPLFHQSGIRNTVLTGWIAGGHVVVGGKFDRSRFWSIVNRHKVTYTCMVETMLLLLEREAAGEDERANTLERVMGGGDPDVLSRCEARFGIRVIQGYGMTENGVAAAVPLTLPPDELDALRRWGQGAFLAGWPLGETEIRLVADGGFVEGEGAKGEIWVRSPSLFDHYLGRADATAESFENGWLKTGDMGVWGPEGALYFVDRIRDVIRRGGENVASKQVEDVLNAHPAIANAAVIPVPDPVFMQEIKAVLVPKPGLSPAPSDLWQWCDARLAGYKVPRYIEFRDSLPLTGSGRVQKQVLRAEGLAGAVIHDRRERTA